MLTVRWCHKLIGPLVVDLHLSPPEGATVGGNHTSWDGATNCTKGQKVKFISVPIAPKPFQFQDKKVGQQGSFFHRLKVNWWPSSDWLECGKCTTISGIKVLMPAAIIRRKESQRGQLQAETKRRKIYHPPTLVDQHVGHQTVPQVDWSSGGRLTFKSTRGHYSWGQPNLIGWHHQLYKRSKGQIYLSSHSTKTISISGNSRTRR